MGITYVRSAVFVLLVLLFTSAGAGCAFRANSLGATVSFYTFSGLAGTKKYVSRFDSSVLVDSFKVSPDNRRVAFWVRTGDKQSVFIDGKAQKQYTYIGGGIIDFSADSKSVAYLANESGKYFMVVDSEEMHPYEGISLSKSVFGRQGDGMAYVAQQGGKYFVVHAGDEGMHYDMVRTGSIEFAPGGDGISYVAFKDNKRFVVSKGKEGKHYDDIAFGPLYSADGKIAYVARENRKQFVVVDGKEGRQYDKVAGNGFTFSADGGRLAYVACNGEKYFVVNEGAEEGPYAAIDEGTPVFSPDGAELAYIASQYSDKDKCQVKPEGPATIKSGRMGMRECTYDTAVVNGNEVAKYDEIREGSLVFSPVGQRLAYAVKKGNKWVMVTDGMEGDPFDSIGKAVFSQDGENVAYAALISGKVAIVINGKVAGHSKCKLVTNPVFSPDGKKVAYVIQKGARQAVVFDGREGEAFDAVVTTGGGSIVFDSPVSLHFLAKQGNGIFLVKERLN